jgi:hypothetical protein
MHNNRNKHFHKEWLDKKPRPPILVLAHNLLEQVYIAVDRSSDKTRCSLAEESREVPSLEQVL